MTLGRSTGLETEACVEIVADTTLRYPCFRSAVPCTSDTHAYERRDDSGSLMLPCAVSIAYNNM